MHPDQTLDNMTLDELRVYSETFFNTPTSVVNAVMRKIQEAITELQEAYEASEKMKQEISDLESENDDLYKVLNDIEAELSEDVPDYDTIQRLVNIGLRG